MLKSSVCDYIDAYIFLSGTITFDWAAAGDNAKRFHEKNKGAKFKTCASITDCMRKINNNMYNRKNE